MDPRTSAKVTAPDLVEAFKEGTGRADEDSGSELRVFVLYSVEQHVTHATENSFSDFEAVMTMVRSHLGRGDGYAVMVVVGQEEPKSVTKAREAISAATG